MDAKNRLVLPLEIRKELGLKKFGSVLLSASKPDKDRSLRIRLSSAEARENDSKMAIPYSKNGKYLKEKYIGERYD